MYSQGSRKGVVKDRPAGLFPFLEKSSIIDVSRKGESRMTQKVSTKNGNQKRKGRSKMTENTKLTVPQRAIQLAATATSNNLMGVESAMDWLEYYRNDEDAVNRWEESLEKQLAAQRALDAAD